jgi:hypothetical protein
MLFPVRFTNNWAVALLVALTCAFAVAYLIDSVLVGSTWWARSLRVGSCLAIACVAFRFGFPRQGPGELLARQHMEALCVTDRRDVSANKQQLPAIDTNSPWSNIFSRIRDCLADDRRRADPRRTSGARPSAGSRRRASSGEAYGADGQGRYTIAGGHPRGIGGAHAGRGDPPGDP